jgi:hypothetical protein
MSDIPVTVKAPAATKVEEEMLVLGNPTLETKSVQDWIFPGFAAPKAGMPSLLEPQPIKAMAAPPIAIVCAYFNNLTMTSPLGLKLGFVSQGNHFTFLRKLKN